LWSRLRANRLGGHHFRRQHAIGGFIVDFCCVKSLVIVERDGAVHENQRGYDETRNEILRHAGFVVLRFANERAIGETDDVLRAIEAACNAGRKGM
jgi:very-short-patch-repair endonuclease